MRFENISQFIVPLTFLAIWAITSLFNREGQPPPPRTNRGPRPEGWNGPGEANPVPGQVRPPQRPEWAPAGARPARPFTAPRGSADDIVILEAGPGPNVGTNPRRPGRGARTPASGKGKGKEGRPQSEQRPPARRSSIEGVTNAQDGTHSVRSEALSPLTLGPYLEIKGSLLTDASLPETVSEKGVAASAFGVTLTPEYLRRNFLLAEVLFRPPVALRGGSLHLGKNGPAEPSSSDV